MNLLGTKVNSGSLNRYSLATMSFGRVVHEEYFFRVLFLRLRTIIGLWIISRFFSRKWVMFMFVCIICCFLGGITALSVMENGVWGVLFCTCAFLPQGIFYMIAYTMWNNLHITSVVENRKKERYAIYATSLAMLVIGIVSEVYITPVLLQNIIKY